MRKKSQGRFFRIIMVFSILGSILTGCEHSKTETQNQDQKQELNQEQNQEQNQKQSSELSSKQEISFEIRKNRMETKAQYISDDGNVFPYMYVNYPSLVISQEMKDGYPKLSQYLIKYSEKYYENAVTSLKSLMETLDEDVSYFTSNYEDLHMEITRADSAVVSILTTVESFNGGAHPYTYYESQVIDSTLGEVLLLSDIVKDSSLLSQAILENLIINDDSYVFNDEENAFMLSTIQQMVENDEIIFTLDDKGLYFYFDAYTLNSYAFGPIFADLSFNEYPELVYEKYLPIQEVTPLYERITYTEGETTRWEDKDLLSNQASENTEDHLTQESWFEIDCPNWEVPYLADGIFDTMTSAPITLKEQSKETTDCLFADEWSARTGIALPATAWEGSYEDDSYQYKIDNDAENGRLSVAITELNGTGMTRNYSFESFIDTPNPGNQYSEPEIPYAKVFDKTLYVEIGHRTYSEEQPDTAYMVAVDVETGTLLWRSEMLVANGRNFVVTQDLIICGYGFTAEDDYLFILSRYSASILEKIKLKSGPDYFIQVDKLLYVLTYNTAYTYSMEIKK